MIMGCVIAGDIDREVRGPNKVNSTISNGFQGAANWITGVLQPQEKCAIMRRGVEKCTDLTEAPAIRQRLYSYKVSPARATSDWVKGVCSGVKNRLTLQRGV
jgi:hypothetical protein